MSDGSDNETTQAVLDTARRIAGHLDYYRAVKPTIAVEVDTHFPNSRRGPIREVRLGSETLGVVYKADGSRRKVTVRFRKREAYGSWKAGSSWQYSGPVEGVEVVDPACGEEVMGRV